MKKFPMSKTVCHCKVKENAETIAKILDYDIEERFVDVVEVVRCRDCVHKKARNPIYVNEGRVYCLKFGQYMLNEGFCSYGKKPEYLFFGERKDNETET